MKLVKYFIILTLTFMFSISACYALTEKEVRDFFNSYVNAANTYQANLDTYYSQNAKILRYVIQKDGSVYPQPLIVGTRDYMAQLRLNAKVAKLRNYKNYYKNISVVKKGNDFKLSADRVPSPSPNDKLKSYFVIGVNASGKLTIKEEMMQTREQIFISQIKKQQAAKK